MQRLIAKVIPLCVKFRLKMNVSSNRVSENRSQPTESMSVATTTVTATTSNPIQLHERHLHAIDLVKVGLSSTLAIGVFFGIGHVVRHVAGPSAIVSVPLAAILAYLVGKFESRHIFQQNAVRLISNVPIW